MVFITIVSIWHLIWRPLLYNFVLQEEYVITYMMPFLRSGF